MQKKVLTILGRIDLKKDHLLQHQAFKMSMYIQSLICLLSQGSVFEDASQILERLLGIDLSAKQFQRVSEWHGAQIDPIVQANHTEYMLVPSKDKDEHTYVMVDACMLFTREEKWKENKLARVFHE